MAIILSTLVDRWIFKDSGSGRGVLSTEIVSMFSCVLIACAFAMAGGVVGRFSRGFGD